MAMSRRQKKYGTILAIVSGLVLTLVLGAMQQLHSEDSRFLRNFPNQRTASKMCDTPTDQASSTGAVTRPKEPQALDEKYEKTCRGPWQNEYQNIHENALKTKRVLLFKGSPAGWGNRIRALLASFHLAVITKRAFIIDCQKPSPLEKYLEPNFIKWNYKINTSRLSVRFHNPGRPPFKEGVDFEEYLNQSVEGIKRYTGYLHLQKHPKYNLPAWPPDYLYYGCIFHYLFKRTSYLENRLTQAKRELGFDKNVVLGIHIRRGDVSFKPNSKDVRMAKIEDAEHHFRCAKHIDSRMQEKYNTKKIIWFLATDSEEVKDYATKNYPHKVKVLNGPIEHVGMPRKGNEDAGHLSMFLDYFLLVQSDIRLFSSNSAFAGAVSWISDGNENSGKSNFKNNRTNCFLPKSLEN